MSQKLKSYQIGFLNTTVSALYSIGLHSRAPLGWAGVGDSDHGCAAEKSALKHEKGVQPSICMVYLINWSLSQFSKEKERE